MSKTLKKITYLIKDYIWLEAVGFSLTILYSIATIGAPLVSQYLIDVVLKLNSTEKLYAGLGIFFIVCVSQPIVGYFKDILFMNITENVTLKIRQKLFSKIINAPMSFFDVTKKGEILSRIINDGRAVSQFITNIFVVLLKNVITIAVILATMLYKSTTLTLIVIGLFTIFFIVNLTLSKRFKQISLEIQKNYDAICVSVNQMTESILTIKSFSAEKNIEKKYSDILRKAYNDNKRTAYLNILINNLTTVLVVLSLCIIYGIGSIAIMKGQMTLGAVVAMGLLFQQLIQPVYELLGNNIEFQKLIPIFDRLYEYFEMESETFIDGAEVPFEGGIKVRGLGFKYKNEDKDALYNVNLNIPSKGLFAFAGPSGAGKSTLVKLLLKLYEPSKGNVYIGNINIKDIPVNILRDKISFVPQDINLFNASVKDNIKYGNPNISDEEIINICKQLKLHEKISSLADDYDSIITERINLSGGEKQRLAIARALAKKPSIFIFDEPTAALDPENEIIIRDMLEKLSENSMVIVIAHRLSTIINSDEIYVFDKGTVVESGTHNTLTANNGIYAEYVMRIEKSAEHNMTA